MIYPLLPAFVTGVLHAGPAFLGLVEGLAEAVASLLKIVSGALSDRVPRRKGLVFGGYLLSSLARPLMALAASPIHVLFVRFADRVGKGVRSAPRDALIAEACLPEDRGRAYGFHRAMDNGGAVFGPLLATAALAAGLPLRVVFALAIVPGVLSLLVLGFGVREVARASAGASTLPSPRSATSKGFARYLGVLALFTLGNSSDAFLILRAQEAGVSLALVPLLWGFHNGVKAVASTHGGALSDRFGRRNGILAGWALYAVSYLGFALAHSAGQSWALFGLYGLYHALTEGAERALVADLAEPAARGRAFGLYHAVTGASLLPASLLTGLLWQAYGARAALLVGAGLAGVAALGLLILVPAGTRRS